MTAFDIDRLTSSAWAMLPSALETLIRTGLGDQKETGEAWETIHGIRSLAGVSNLKDDAADLGIGIVSVLGVLLAQGHTWRQSTNYDAIRRELDDYAADQSIKHLVLAIDSPGGDAVGIEGVPNRIAALRDSGRFETIVAVTTGQMASGAYWIGSAADSVVAGETSIVGSIGAIYTATDWSGWDTKRGIREIVLRSSQSPLKALDPATPEGEAGIQTMLDAIAGVFVEHVARGRGIDETTVLAEYGGGGVFVGKAALAAGLVDRIASIDQVVEELGNGTFNAAESAATQEIYTMTLNVASLDLTTLRAQNPALAEALSAAGAENERARILAAGADGLRQLAPNVVTQIEESAAAAAASNAPPPPAPDPSTVETIAREFPEISAALELAGADREHDRMLVILATHARASSEQAFLALLDDRSATLESADAAYYREGATQSSSALGELETDAATAPAIAAGLPSMTEESEIDALLLAAGRATGKIAPAATS